MKINNKIVLVSGAGKGIGLEIFMKCLDNAKFTYGIVRSRKDYLKLSKLKNKNNFKIFLGDIKNKFFIEKILNFSKKNNKIIDGLINNVAKDKELIFLS